MALQRLYSLRERGSEDGHQIRFGSSFVIAERSCKCSEQNSQNGAKATTHVVHSIDYGMQSDKYRSAFCGAIIKKFENGLTDISDSFTTIPVSHNHIPFSQTRLSRYGPFAR